MSQALPVWVQVLRWFFALLLLSTAAGKMLDMPGFFGVVDSYQVLPELLIAPSAIALTATEFLLGVWLVTALRLPFTLLQRIDQAASAVVALHVLYMAWLLPAWLRGLELKNCGCFGVYFPRPLTGQTLIEDSVLLGAAIALMLGARAAQAKKM